jgi:uncharacterized protein
VKLLLIVLVVLVVAWRWRGWRETRLRKPVKKSTATAPKSIGMVPCHHCGVHVPAEDAVPGTLGSYCSAAHQLKKEA